VTIRDSWRRRAADSRRVRAARTARSARDSPGWADLALQDGDLVAQHQDLGVLAVVGAGQQGQPAAQPHEDQVKQAEGHERLIVSESELTRC